MVFVKVVFFSAMLGGVVGGILTMTADEKQEKD